MPDPALIDPSLPVDRRRPDHAGAAMGYWPSYSMIAPGCRAAYLQWLADGRHAHGAYIGYVFLYFYGLERRLLVDARQSAAARAEQPALIAEVRRLLGIYGRDGSFRGYAEGLLKLMTPAISPRRYLSAPPARRDGWAVPAELRLGLGQLAADRRPLPADWALAWLRLHPEGWLRTPATRCPDEFGEVFTRRYRDSYGDGQLIEPGGSVIDSGYHPASAAISARHLPAGPRIPDVADLGEPLARLREVAGEACDDLDAYSRYLGRHPDAAGTAAALALLPAGIERPADAATQALVAWAEDSLGASDSTPVATAELLARWSAAAPDSRPGRQSAVLLAQLLERHGLGMEPDVSFGGPAPSARAPVVLFRRSAEIISAPSHKYTAAAAMIQLGAAVASADGRVAAAEQDLLERRVIRAAGLADDERRRLRAHLTRLLADPPSPAALRKPAALLSDHQRHQAGDLLRALSASDGTVSEAEAGLLTRLTDALGLGQPPVRVPNQGGGGGDLARLRTAGAPARGYFIPPPAPPPPTQTQAGPAVVLDPEVIKARLADSARAASYLADIFTDDDTITSSAVSPGPPAADSTGGNAAGLDAAHSTLLSRLAAQPSWTRSELDTVAGELGLLPGGAVEILNEAAFEAVGEPVCEGADPIDINRDVLEEMLR